MNLKPLYRWYGKNQRALPFRGQNDPYRIWISEVMLQQTRVEAMLPLYGKFIARFPDVETLSAAQIEDVLDSWRGLGYYSRARNLYRGARYIQNECRGVFPETVRELLLVPGIGPYTAAAVASIGFGEPAAVVDGNVRRVLTRLLGTKVGSRALQQEADALMNQRGSAEPAVHNQALMELGSLVCLPRAPRCKTCPLISGCHAGMRGQAFAEALTRQERPPPVEVEMEVFVIGEGGGIWLMADAEAAFLAGQWFFPVNFSDAEGGLSGTPGRFPRRGRRVAKLTHTITKYRISMIPVEVAARKFQPRSNDRIQWRRVSWPEARRLVVSSAGSKILRALNP